MHFTSLEFIDGIWLLVKWLYFLPGDLLVACLSNTDIGRFYEFSNSDNEGVFSFFVPWFFVAFMMSSIDDTKSGGILFFNKGKKIITKNGRKRVGLLFIALLIFGSVYFVLHSLNIKNSWIDLLLIIFIVFTVWYTLSTDGYSFKRNKFRKVKQLLTKKGRKNAAKMLLLSAILLILYLMPRFINYSCSFVIFLIPVLSIVFYFSIGNRWKKLKNSTVKVYKNTKLSFTK